MQYVKYTKYTKIALEITFKKNKTNVMCFGKSKTQQQNRQSNIKVLVRAGNRTRNLSHPGLMLNL